MISIILNIVLQILAVTIAMLVGVLDYVLHDKDSRRYKAGRKWLFILSGILLLSSIYLTYIDWIDNRQREISLNRKLGKLESQNDAMQRTVAVLSEDQRSRFLSLLDIQQEVGTATARNIAESADLLRNRIESSIALLNENHEKIVKAANPIRNITIDVESKTKLETERGIVYRSRFEKALFDLGQKEEGLKAIGDLYARDGGINVYIAKAPYAPDEKNEPEAYYALNVVILSLSFYKNNVTAEEIFDQKIEPDLHLETMGSKVPKFKLPNKHPLSTVSLSYDLKTSFDDRWFRLRAYNMVPFKQESNGQIVSIPDLSGSTMLVHLGGDVRFESQTVTSEVEKIYKTIKIENMKIKMSEGRFISINGEDLLEYTDHNNNKKFYVYNIPN